MKNNVVVNYTLLSLNVSQNLFVHLILQQISMNARNVVLVSVMVVAVRTLGVGMSASVRETFSILRSKILA